MKRKIMVWSVFWDGGTFAMIKRADGTIGDKYTYDGIMRGAKEGKYPF